MKVAAETAASPGGSAAGRCDSPTRRAQQPKRGGSALASLEAPLRLVDNVNASLAPHDAIVAMAAAERFQRITDFHEQHSRCRRLLRRDAAGLSTTRRRYAEAMRRPACAARCWPAGRRPAENPIKRSTAWFQPAAHGQRDAVVQRVDDRPAAEHMPVVCSATVRRMNSTHAAKIARPTWSKSPGANSSKLHWRIRSSEPKLRLRTRRYEYSALTAV